MFAGKSKVVAREAETNGRQAASRRNGQETGTRAAVTIPYKCNLLREKEFYLHNRKIGKINKKDLDSFLRRSKGTLLAGYPKCEKYKLSKPIFFFSGQVLNSVVKGTLGVSRIVIT